MQSRLVPLSVLCLLAGMAGMRAAEGDSVVRLTGITHINGHARAHLEITGPPPRTHIIRPILAEGERVGAVEVRMIDSQAGLVRIANNGVETTLPLDGKPGDAKRTLHFKEAHVDQVLDTYQELSGRTVLPSSDLPAAKFNLKTATLPQADALRLLEDAFLARGIVIDLRADKFALVVRSEQTKRLSFIRMPPAPEVAPIESDTKKILAGQIKFQSADPFQALEIYQELSGRVAVHSSALRGGKISLRTQTPLTRREAAWALEASLALADVAVVPQGEKVAFALSGIENPQIPVLDPPPEQMPAGEPRWIILQNAKLGEALQLYANLLGRKPLALDPTTPAARLSIRTPVQVTPLEGVLALDALAAVNNLKFVLVGDHQVKIIPAPLARIKSRPDAP